MTTIQTHTITRPDDWHLHLRDGEMLQAIVGHTTAQFDRAIIMPNLTPPVTTTEQARAYHARILSALKSSDGINTNFKPLMTLYLTDNTNPAEIRTAKESGLVHGVKLYPAGATTNSDAGVTNLLKHCAKTLEAMQEVGMPLLMHGEVTDPSVDIFDREAVFIDRVMIPLRKQFPALKVVFEHLTTAEGVAYVSDAEGPVAATITPHHLLYNRNALFVGGLRPHWYCLPVLKRELHREALLKAATGDTGRFFLGTDSAPHSRGRKEQDCGCAGCYTAFHAMELYATAFDSVGKIDRLQAFASENGPAFYGLEPNSGTLTLEKRSFDIPVSLSLGADEIVPLAGGTELTWSVKTS